MTSRLPSRLSTMIVLGLAATATIAQAECDQITFRAWTSTGETWFAQGEPVIVAPDVETHLYVHHDAGPGSTPYRTRAQMGHASDFGFRVRSGNVTFRRQQPADAQAGRLVLNAQNAAEAVLGYRITNISQAGVFDRLPAKCRTGVVSVQVRRAGNGGGGSGNGGGEDPQAANLASRQLQRRIHLALEPWETSPNADADEIAEIRKRGRDAVIEIAARVLSSQEFRDSSWDWTVEGQQDLSYTSEHYTPRVGVVANRLLDEIYARLYGGQRVDSQTQRRNLEDLMACLDSRGDRGACGELARRLVSHQHYSDHNREPLEAIRGERR